MSCSAEKFRHLYIESSILDHPETKRIRSLFPNAVCIPVERYTDVFSRPHQSYRAQYDSMNLILAEKHGTAVYPGAPVCHDFGSERFFYTAMAVNCLYDCSYCWLKGMYNTANLVIFINLEKAFEETEKLLEEGPLYLSLSFESDLLPLETLTHQIQRWNEFVKRHPGLSTEIRTKCGADSIYASLDPDPGMIFAFTLSPQSVINALEKGTASLHERLKAAGTALERGFPVRLCFDPMIRIPNWQEEYAGMVLEVSKQLDLSRVKDISIGTYRQSDTYQRRMRKRFPASAVIQYPYETKNGYCQYPEAEKNEMEQFLKQELIPFAGEEKIFLLEDNS